jgi:Fungal Zn(2)-Cys(6) binuclear cluster domain
MSEPPSSVGPPRKRRRPALSCEQCRHRKIKCDRTYPCGQCLQSKTTVCSYSADTVRRPRHVSETNPACPGTVFRSLTDIPTRTRDVPGDLIAHTSSDGVSPNVIPHSEVTHSSSWTSPSAHAHDDEPPDPKTLLHRLENIEKKLASSYNFPTCESYNSDSRSKGLRGTVSKTRLFGPSHWMHSYGVVRHLLQATW